MNTNTRSIDHLTTAFTDAEPDWVEQDGWPAFDDPYEPRGWSSTPRTRLASVVDEFAHTPGGRRVLHGWFQRELLTDALELLADADGGDPLLLSPRALASAFETNLFCQVIGDTDDLAQLPDVLGYFVPYAHAIRGVSTSGTAAALAIIAHARDGFGHALARRREAHPRPVGPWRLGGRWEPLPQPSPIEVLAAEVGGREQLDALSSEPLPDEPLDLAQVLDDVRVRVREAADLADPVLGRVFDVEMRTAVRRFLADVAAADPEIFRRKARSETAAVAASLAVGQANHRVRPHGTMTALELTGHFGLAHPPSSRVLTMRRAVLGRPTGWAARTELGSPRYLTAERRADIVASRDRLRADAVVEPES